MIVIVTAPSWAGKTTVVSYILWEEWTKWSKPINFTTRDIRGDEELDDYVFLTKEQFETKKENGDFAETNYYEGNYYWVSRFFERDKNYIAIMENKGRKELEEWLIYHWYEYKKIFILVSREEVEGRMRKRWSSEEAIASRMKTFDQFTPDEGSIIINGNLPLEEVVKEFKDIIEEEGS